MLIIFKNPNSFLFLTGNEEQLLAVIGLLISCQEESHFRNEKSLFPEVLYIFASHLSVLLGRHNLQGIWRYSVKLSKEETTNCKLILDYLTKGRKRKLNRIMTMLSLEIQF